MQLSSYGQGNPLPDPDWMGNAPEPSEDSEGRRFTFVIKGTYTVMVDAWTEEDALVEAAEMMDSVCSEHEVLSVEV